MKKNWDAESKIILRDFKAFKKLYDHYFDNYMDVEEMYREYDKLRRKMLDENVKEQINVQN